MSFGKGLLLSKKVTPAAQLKDNTYWLVYRYEDEVEIESYETKEQCLQRIEDIEAENQPIEIKCVIKGLYLEIKQRREYFLERLT